MTEVDQRLRFEPVRLHTFATFYLDDGPARVFDGMGECQDLDGLTYRGIGGFGGVDLGEEKLSEPAGRLTLRLSGVAADSEGGEVFVDGLSEKIQETLTGARLQGRRVRIFTAETNDRGTEVTNLLNDFVRGLIDQVMLDDSDEARPVLEVMVEDETLLAREVTPRRYGIADHQLLNPGSTWMVQTSDLTRVPNLWGI